MNNAFETCNDWEKKYLGASEEVKSLRESLMRAEAEVRVEKAAGTEAKASLKPLNKQVKRLQQTVSVSDLLSKCCFSMRLVHGQF